jgi:hypothetical protein
LVHLIDRLDELMAAQRDRPRPGRTDFDAVDGREEHHLAFGECAADGFDETEWFADPREMPGELDAGRRRREET